MNIPAIVEAVVILYILSFLVLYHFVLEENEEYAVWNVIWFVLIAPVIVVIFLVGKIKSTKVKIKKRVKHKIKK